VHDVAGLWRMRARCGCFGGTPGAHTALQPSCFGALLHQSLPVVSVLPTTVVVLWHANDVTIVQHTHPATPLPQPTPACAPTSPPPLLSRAERIATHCHPWLLLLLLVLPLTPRAVCLSQDKWQACSDWLLSRSPSRLLLCPFE